MNALSKTDGLGPRYKQPCGVGVHVEMLIYLPTGRRELILGIRRLAVKGGGGGWWVNNI